eukprot:gene25051-56947_t
MEQRAGMERELQEHTVEDAVAARELQEHVDALARTPAGMDQPLVDAEGYPRDDCDLM